MFPIKISKSLLFLYSGKKGIALPLKVRKIFYCKKLNEPTEYYHIFCQISLHVTQGFSVLYLDSPNGTL